MFPSLLSSIPIPHPKFDSEVQVLATPYILSSDSTAQFLISEEHLGLEASLERGIDPAMAVEQASLEGLAEEWEADKKLRRRFRETRRLWTSTGGEPEPPIHVQQAAVNQKALEGIARRMGEEYRSTGIYPVFKVKMYEAETLDHSH